MLSWSPALGQGYQGRGTPWRPRLTCGSTIEINLRSNTIEVPEQHASSCSIINPQADLRQQDDRRSSYIQQSDKNRININRLATPSTCMHACMSTERWPLRDMHRGTTSRQLASLPSIDNRLMGSPPNYERCPPFRHPPYRAATTAPQRCRRCEPRQICTARCSARGSWKQARLQHRRVVYGVKQIN